MIERELQNFKIPLISQRFFNNHRYGLEDVQNGSSRAAPWTCFHIENNTSIYFDLFGGCSDNFLLQQYSKAIISLENNFQDTISILCGLYC